MNIDQYLHYKRSNKANKKDCDWEQNIVNTKLECYGKTASKVKEFFKFMSEADQQYFLNALQVLDHFDSILHCLLLNNITYWNQYKKELKRYLLSVDNWASCDALKFNKHSKDNLKQLSDELLQSKNKWARRVAIDIYFELIKDKQYLPLAFKMLDGLKNETEYYVNMAAAWLLCECVVKYGNETKDYLQQTKTNKFIINKAISKCKDSYRILPNMKQEIAKNKKQ